MLPEKLLNNIKDQIITEKDNLIKSFEEKAIDQGYLDWEHSAEFTFDELSLESLEIVSDRINDIIYRFDYIDDGVLDIPEEYEDLVFNDKGLQKEINNFCSEIMVEEI